MSSPDSADESDKQQTPSHSGRLARRRKVALSQAQAKAWELFCGAGGDRGIPVSRTPRANHCPLCFGETPFEELTEEHVPQRNAPSAFGRSMAVALTCGRCNGGAGRSFEATSAQTASLGWDLDVDHGRSGSLTTASGLLVASSSLAADRVLTEVKSAYLLAWLTLGYGWAHSVHLNNLRSCIRNGYRPSGKDAHLVDHLQPDFVDELTVIEFVAPAPVLLVAAGGQSSFGVMLRCHGTPDVSLNELDPAALGVPSNSFKLHHRRVPDLSGSGQQVDRAWDDELLFHIDRCNKGHHGTGVTARESIVAEVLLGQAVAGGAR